MNRDQRRRRNVLKCLVLTKEQPTRIRRSERVVSSLCFLTMMALLMGPILYFRDIGLEKYVIAGAAALAGIIGMGWQIYLQSNRTAQDLHAFIDFEKVKSALEEG